MQRCPRSSGCPNEMGVRGGIEYGFSSTTTDKSQALSYATGGGGGKQGEAMTIFEMQMGMVDRGADLTWLSQYPHEREVLLPPLTGIEALGTDVEGGDAGDPLTPVAKHGRTDARAGAERRRKMLMDMASGIELELRDQLGEHIYQFARKIFVNVHPWNGAYQHPPLVVQQRRQLVARDPIGPPRVSGRWST